VILKNTRVFIFDILNVISLFRCICCDLFGGDCSRNWMRNYMVL